MVRFERYCGEGITDTGEMVDNETTNPLGGGETVRQSVLRPNFSVVEECFNVVT